MLKMDRSWITIVDRTRPEYDNGVQQFLNFAYSSTEPGERIRCPCRKCCNVCYQNRDDVEADLFQYGIMQDYVKWVCHGEDFDESTDDEIYSDEKEDGNTPELDEANKGILKRLQSRPTEDSLEPPSKRVQRTNKELEVENEELRKQAEESRKIMESLKRDMTDVELRFESLKNERKDMELRLESLRKERKDMELSLQSLKSQVNQVQAILIPQPSDIVQNSGIVGQTRPPANVGT